MAREIERKFLLKNDSWRFGASGEVYRQGYISVAPDRTVRVRTLGERAVLTIKGKTSGATRLEFEYDIPFQDAIEMLDRLCHEPIIEKTRYVVRMDKHTWEIDEFAGDNKGLVVAEVELAREDETLELPDWIDKEVTADPRYYNANLVSNPYSSWHEKD